MTTATAPSEKQIAFAKDLINTREVDNRDELLKRLDTIDRKQASQWIDMLLKRPYVNVERPKIESNVPAGRYAITGKDGTTDFYIVNRPDKGRWSGYIFVSLQMGDEQRRVPLNQVQSILDRIESDGAESASKRYGLELGHCGVCGRTLTNADSLERGIGPVCAARHGWSF